jgi:integrase
MASIKMTTRCLIEWQLHTLTRPGEAAGTKWDEIDLNAKLWTIPADRMKAKRLHIVPLTDQALAILNVMSDISQNNDYVFPSDRAPQKPTNSSTANVALKRMGFHNELVAHGLRSLASTTLNEQGFDSDLIETALAHRGQNEVRNAYNRALYIDRRIPMMEWWSDHIAKASIGSRSVIAKGQFDL